MAESLEVNDELIAEIEGQLVRRTPGDWITRDAGCASGGFRLIWSEEAQLEVAESVRSADAQLIIDAPSYLQAFIDDYKARKELLEKLCVPELMAGAPPDVPNFNLDVSDVIQALATACVEVDQQNALLRKAIADLPPSAGANDEFVDALQQLQRI